ncbi:MAG: NADP oxidoreductase [Anaerolineae bacterium]|jgi:NAD-reducing hydrogenase small subunit|nr:NADP oxidoreductase [Chloroflexota bacterium]
MAKVTLCTDWLDVCSGCHMSLLDIDEGLATLFGSVQLLSSPITDLKHPPIEGADVGILTGSVSNDHQEEVARRMRERVRILVSMGDCSVFGGICTMRNFFNVEDVLRHAYVETDSTAPNQAVPRSPEIAKLYPKVRPLREVVKVDYYIPGCPPSAKAIAYVVTELASGREPAWTEDLLRYG